MKFDKKKIMYVILVVCLVSCIIVVRFLESKNKQEAPINFDNLVIDVNMATNTAFITLDNYALSLDLLIDFDENTEFVYAANEDKTDYFIVARNLNKEEINEIETFVDMQKKLNEIVKMEKNNDYIYLISSSEYSSTIDGIIRSYINE